MDQNAMIDFNSQDFINSLINKDDLSFRKIIHAYSGILKSYGMRKGFFGTELHELIQNTWITFYEKIQNFKGNSHIRTFLIGIFNFKAKELIRERIKFSYDTNPALRKFASSLPFEVPSPEQNLIEKQTLINLNESLSRMPHMNQRVFDLKIIQGLSSKQICNLTQISQNHLNVLIHRTRAKLLAELKA